MIHVLLSPFLPALLAPVVPAPVLNDPSDEHRPPYAFLRRDEDWSDFEAADPPVDWFDPWKHVTLSDDGDWWVSFGGRVESRLENWTNFGFGAANDDSFVLSRALVHADLHGGDRFRFYLEGKSAQATDRDLPGGRRTLDLDTLALQQAFADFVFPLGDNATLTLRPGRQMLLFGAQRLVSPLPWGNTLRTWDGLTAVWKRGPWSVTGLLTAFAPVQKTSFNDTDKDDLLYGLYARRAPAKGGHGLELYALGNERENVTVNGTTGGEVRQTFGTRLWGPVGETTDYEVELSLQTGSVGAGDVSAWSVASQAGWRPEGWAGAPRLFLGVDAASGDDAPGGDVGTFHQLFPLGHAYFGFIDAVGRQNILDVSAGSKWKLGGGVGLLASLHSFRVLETADALYNAGGAPARTGFTSDDVGTEVDLMADRNFGRHLATYAGYSHFFPGDAIEQSGPSEDTDFLYVGFRWTF